MRGCIERGRQAHDLESVWVLLGMTDFWIRSASLDKWESTGVTYVVYCGQAEGIVATGDEGEGEKGGGVEMVGDCELYFDGEDQ